MPVKCFLLLLGIFYKVNSDTSSKYPPCDNKITFAYDNTLALDEAAYRKEVNFLTNYVFEEWNNFNGLTLFSDGNNVFKTDFKSKDEVKDYILNDKQVDNDVNACRVFDNLNFDEDLESASFIIFLREFNEDEVDFFCEICINGLNSKSYSILFVPLSNAVNVDDLQKAFPKATILVWDENKDTPDDWKEQFNKNFGCDASQTTKIPTTPAKFTTTQPPVKYPCNREFLFVVETSTKLNALAFQRQLNFLANYTFEKWNNFYYLRFLETGNLNNFKTVSSKNIESNNTACSVFDKIDGEINARIVLFLNGFDSSDIIDGCNSELKGILSRGNSLLFVPLSEKFNQTILKHYYSQASIIEWNITEEAPDDWENQFNDFYDCEDYKTTTAVVHSSTTESPINSYPPCDSTVAIAFDKSNGLSEHEHQLEKDFLTSHVFQNWTRFGQLKLFSFADHVYSTVVPLKDSNELAEFVESEEQIDSNPDLCNLLYYSLNAGIYHAIIFLSTLNGTDLNTKRQEWFYGTCQRVIDIDLNVQVTIVLLNDAINTDTLRQHIPQAQFIKLNLSEVPENWEWHFKTAYGCNQDNYNDQTMYPCNSKFIFAYETSSGLDSSTLNAQRDFLTNNVFNSVWNVFNNLALISYSNETQTKDFGTMFDLNDVHSFVDSSFKQNDASRTSLCKLFKELTTMYLFEVNIVMFVSNFHEGIGDECSIWIKQLRDNGNFINFINLTQDVNVEYLLFHFPQARITYFNDKVSDNWNVESYGCQNFVVNATDYPCLINDIPNAVIYDRSHYLSTFAYQRLTNFLLAKVYIEEWTGSFSIYTYPDDANSDELYSMPIELFIRQSLRSNKEPLICETLNEATPLKDSRSNLLFFVSKFDETIFELDFGDCSVKTINEYANNITFIALTELINKTFLLKVFPNAIIFYWNITENEEFSNWNQVLWGSFGCHGDSSIILPPPITTSTSTYMPTTPTQTSTTHQITSTTLTSTKHSTLTTTLTTTTTYSSSTQTTTTQSSNKPNIPLIVCLSVLVPLIVIILITSIVCFCLYRQRKRSQMIDNMAFKIGNGYDAKREENVDLWRIDSENIEVYIDHKLGSGAFASVYLGKLYGDAGINLVYPDIIALRSFSNCEVAIKILPAYATESDKNDFKQELIFMKNLKHHKHIVCLLGYTTEKIILEYCANGDLMHFLKKKRDTFNAENESSLKLKDLISFAWQVANGMEYFASLSLVHRDLAARNVLLTNELVCKVSDFGLARESDLQSYTSKRRMPVRWLPPEALKSSEYSTKTDVWSYGVLLYEVFSLANLPYADIENSEILHFIDSGNRLEQPEHSPDEIYSIMIDCWSAVPDGRPTFTEICQKLIPSLETFSVHYNYVNPIETIVEETNELAMFDDFFDDDCSV